MPERNAILALLGFVAKNADGDGFPILAGWNVGFDHALLKAAWGRHGLGWPFSHRMMDVQSVWAFWWGWDFKGLTHAASRVLGEAPQHRALPDALLTLRLLRMLLEGRESSWRDAAQSASESADHQRRAKSS